MLGGKGSNFTLAEGFNFTFQHDARVISENETTTVLSLFDNASDGYNQSAAYSSGMTAAIHHPSRSATRLTRYIAPMKQISASQGNTQLLPNGNVFCGWGSNAYISEYLHDGTAVMEGHFATTGSMHYRAFKFNFTAQPTDTPATYVYAPNNTRQANTTWYVSWNGATEVRSWQIYTASRADGELSKLNSTFPKVGFETIHSLKGFYAISVIEALDGDGKAIRNTTIQTTFVPGQGLGSACDDSGCAVATNYAFKPTQVPLKGASGSPTILDAVSTSTTTHTQGTAQPTTSKAAGSQMADLTAIGWIGLGLLLMGR